MNKALDLLRRLASGDNMGDFFISNELLKEIEAILAQPVKYQFTTRLDQESVMYQYRDKLDGKDWGRWNLCNKIDYEDYKNNPTFQHWTYQTRKLLAQPEQEIVCWGSFNLNNKCVGTHETRRLAAQIQGGNEVYPLYTSPLTCEYLIDDAFEAGYQKAIEELAKNG